MAASEIEQTKMKIDHLKKEISSYAPKLQNAEKQNEGLIKEIRSSKKLIADTKVYIMIY